MNEILKIMIFVAFMTSIALVVKVEKMTKEHNELVNRVDALQSIIDEINQYE